MVVGYLVLGIRMDEQKLENVGRRGRPKACLSKIRENRSEFLSLFSTKEPTVPGRLLHTTNAHILPHQQTNSFDTFSDLTGLKFDMHSRQQASVPGQLMHTTNAHILPRPKTELV